MAAINRIREEIKLDKPIIVGATILDISKTIMYDFHYNYIIKEFPKAQLLFTDTDSLTYLIPSKNIYEDFMKSKERFDLSNQDPNSKYFDATNKGVTGVFKDETPGSVITKFVGLRAKCYSIIKENTNTHKEANDKRCKGIKKDVVKNEINHDLYDHVLLTRKEIRMEMNCIRSNDLVITTNEVKKAALTSYDDKRYLLSDGIKSLAYGNEMIDDIMLSDNF